MLSDAVTCFCLVLPAKEAMHASGFSARLFRKLLVGAYEFLSLASVGRGKLVA